MLEVRDIVKTFDGRAVVNRVSFEVRPGEIFALLGPNGAGKTTLIRMITDILKPDSGEIVLDGSRVGGDSRRQIAYLPEERGLYRRVSPIDVLVYYGELKGLSAHAARAAGLALLERMELAEWATKQVQTLSKGMQQKVQFCTALIGEPAAPDPGRALHRPRPAQHAALRGDPRRAPRGGQHGAALDPPDEQGRGAVRPRADDQPRAHGALRLGARLPPPVRGPRRDGALRPAPGRRDRRPRHRAGRRRLEAHARALRQPAVGAAGPGGRRRWGSSRSRSRTCRSRTSSCRSSARDSASTTARAGPPSRSRRRRAVRDDALLEARPDRGAARVPDRGEAQGVPLHAHRGAALLRRRHGPGHPRRDVEPARFAARLHPAGRRGLLGALRGRHARPSPRSMAVDPTGDPDEARDLSHRRRVLPGPGGASSGRCARGEISQALVIPADYLASGALRRYARSDGIFTSSAAAALDRALAHAQPAGRAADSLRVERATRPVASRWTSTPSTRTGEFESKDDRREMLEFMVPFMFSILLGMCIITGGQYLLQGVSEEKESRILESLLCTLSAGGPAGREAAGPGRAPGSRWWRCGWARAWPWAGRCWRWRTCSCRPRCSRSRSCTSCSATCSTPA